MTKARSNATANAAKGDLTVGNGTNLSGVLAVGNTGDTIVADSSTSTGLRWQGDYAAGKNKIINGDFNINQRNFTSNTTTGTFNFDRFRQVNSGGTVTVTPQTFTAGAAPVAGYEAKNFLQIVSASQSGTSDYAGFNQPIEDVRSFAGQTVTMSFWAKASTGTPSIGVAMYQDFGTGGSSAVTTSPATQAITASWARYSFTVAIPSISGKTIGTGSNLAPHIFTSVGTTISGAGFPAVGIQNVTVGIWGVQVEAGSVATAFQTATGTIQGELAACQRYFQQVINGDTQNIGVGWNYSSSYAMAILYLPVVMRTAPTIAVTSGTNYYTFERNGALDPVNAFFGAANTNPNNAITLRNSTEISGTAANAGLFFSNNASANISLSAEL